MGCPVEVHSFYRAFVLFNYNNYITLNIVGQYVYNPCLLTYTIHCAIITLSFVPLFKPPFPPDSVGLMSLIDNVMIIKKIQAHRAERRHPCFHRLPCMALVSPTTQHDEIAGSRLLFSLVGVII